MLEQVQKQNFEVFQQNVDSWIKEFNGRLGQLSSISEVIDENLDNTNHNYEMVNQLQQQVQDLKQEVKTLRLMQLLMLKKSLNKKE